MFLAVPLTMVIKVSLQTSEDLAWIAVLMDNRVRAKKAAIGDEPALAVDDSVEVA